MKRSFVVLAVLLGLAIASCTNDPFDPDSVTNQIPVVSFFVESIDPDDEFNPTSYYQRRFHWSGADADGRIEEFYVAIRTNTDPDAPWTSTTRTDTTITFVPDSEGVAEAVFPQSRARLGCDPPVDAGR